MEAKGYMNIRKETVGFPDTSIVPVYFDQGKKLAAVLCADCHGEDYSGKPLVNDEAVGFRPAPNLTSGEGDASGEFTDADWILALRHGVDPHESRAFVAMPSMNFAYLSDQDLGKIVAYLKSTPPVAHEKMVSVVADWRLVGDPRLTAIALNNLSWTSMKLGLFDEARLTLEESIALSESVGDRWTMGLAYRGLGTIAQKKGEHARAAEIFRKNLEIFTELGMRQFAARTLAEMSRSLFELGDEQEAEHGWRKAFQIASEAHGNFGALEALLGIAALKAKRGDVFPAYRLALLVPSHPLAVQDNQERAARLRAELENQLTPAQLESVQAHIDELTMEAVIAELLKE